MQTSYITAAANATQLPPLDAPEIAVIGRSNCGKSSLLNALMGARLARMSRTPGRTQMLDFFRVQSQERVVTFCDLPGWGYSEVAGGTREHWEQLADAYFAQRPQIVAVLCLLDIRRNFQPDELLWLRTLPQRQQVLFVFTKCDKVRRNELRQRERLLKTQLSQAGFGAAQTFTVSVLPRNYGITELQSYLFGLA